MRIRRLELNGIGPFAGTVHLDFDLLSASGKFLLQGPTGSGKSTLLDAITYALYGDVTGNKQLTQQRLRSLFADPRIASYVDLVFTVDSGTYRVRRSPEWTKAGNKNPTNPKATLWRLSEEALDSGLLDSAEPLCAKVNEVSSEIVRILGLSRTQFQQTITLPQGQFANFLRLESEERTALLEKIFNTGVYAKVAEELKLRAGDASKRVASARSDWHNAVNSTVSVSGEELDLSGSCRLLSVAAQAETIHSELSALVARLADREHIAAAEAQHAELAVNAAQARFDEDSATHKLISRRNALLAQKHDLDAQKPEIALLTAALDAHVEATTLAPTIAAYHDAVATLTSAREALDDEDSTLAEAQEKLEALINESTRIDALVAQESELTSLCQREDSLSEELEHTEERLASIRAQVTAIPQQISDAEAEYAAALEAQTLAVTVQNEREGLLGTLATTTSLSQLLAEESEIAISLDSSRDRLRAAIAARDEATQAWIGSSAAELAHQLEPGHPCPVCGSCEHPSPAPAPRHFASRDDVEYAESLASAAREKFDSIQQQSSTLAGKISRLRAELGDATEESVTKQLAGVEKHLAMLQKQSSSAAEYRQKIHQLRDAMDKLRCDEQVAISEQASLTSTRAEVVAQKQSIARTLTTEYHGYASMTERSSAHRAAVSEQRVRVTRCSAFAQAQHEEQLRSQDLAHRISASAFANADAATRALLSTAAATELRQRADLFTRELSLVTHDLESSEITSLGDQPLPDLSTSEDSLLRAQEAHKEALSRFTRAEQTLALTRKALRHTERAAQVWASEESQAGSITRLADLANGGSLSLTHVPLATYVVQQRFEKIIEVANEHLMSVSRGRYALTLASDKERGSRKFKTGLGLSIIDHHASTDTERSTKSLSGGETFYVSLSLALALADIVRAENGGITLDTLLIDEGFGSLDEHTLERVMEVLSGLSRNGRTVGIVSHVSEMRHRIAEQVNIIPNGDGSSRIEVRA